MAHEVILLKLDAGDVAGGSAGAGAVVAVAAVAAATAATATGIWLLTAGCWQLPTDNWWLAAAKCCWHWW